MSCDLHDSPVVYPNLREEYAKCEKETTAAAEAFAGSSLLTGLTKIQLENCIGDSIPQIDQNFDSLFLYYKTLLGLNCGEYNECMYTFDSQEERDNINPFYPHGTETGAEAELPLVPGGLAFQTFNMASVYHTDASKGNLSKLPLSGPFVVPQLIFPALPQNFGVLAIGYFVPPTTGTYTFKTTSSDGSGIWLGETALGWTGRSSSNALVNNDLDNDHLLLTASGSVYLSAGIAQPIRIVSYTSPTNTTDGTLEVSWSGPGIAETTDLTAHFYVAGNIPWTGESPANADFSGALGPIPGAASTKYYKLWNYQRTATTIPWTEIPDLAAINFYLKRDGQVKTFAPHLRVNIYQEPTSFLIHPFYYSKSTSVLLTSTDYDLTSETEWTNHQIVLPPTTSQSLPLWVEFERLPVAYYNPFLETTTFERSQYVLNNWTKISHCSTSGSATPCDPSHIAAFGTGWASLGANNDIGYANSDLDATGIISDIEYEDYDFEATVTSFGAEDGNIGLVLGFTTENGYEQTLVAWRNGGGNVPSGIFTNSQWRVTLNSYRDPDLYSTYEWTPSNTFSSPQSWSGAYTKIRASKRGPILTIDSTPFNSDDYAIDSKIVINLDSSDTLRSFKKSKIGFICQEQSQSRWQNVSFKIPEESVPEGVIGVGNVSYITLTETQRDSIKQTRLSPLKCIKDTLIDINSNFLALSTAVIEINQCCANNSGYGYFQPEYRYIQMETPTPFVPEVFPPPAPLPFPTPTPVWPFPSPTPSPDPCPWRTDVLDRVDMYGDGNYDWHAYTFSYKDKMYALPPYAGEYYDEIIKGAPGTLAEHYNTYKFEPVVAGKQYYGLQNVLKFAPNNFNKMAMFTDGHIFTSGVKRFHQWLYDNRSNIKDVYAPSSTSPFYLQCVLTRTGELRALDLDLTIEFNNPPIIKGLQLNGVERDLNNVTRIIYMNPGHNSDMIVACANDTVYHVVLKSNNYSPVDSTGTPVYGYGKQLANLKDSQVLFATLGDPEDSAFVVLRKSPTTLYRFDYAAGAQRNDVTFRWLTGRKIAPESITPFNSGLTNVNPLLEPNERFIDGVANKYHYIFLTNKYVHSFRAQNTGGTLPAVSPFYRKHLLPTGTFARHICSATAYSVVIMLSDGYYLLSNGGVNQFMLGAGSNIYEGRSAQIKLEKLVEWTTLAIVLASEDPTIDLFYNECTKSQPNVFWTVP